MRYQWRQWLRIACLATLVALILNGLSAFGASTNSSQVRFGASGSTNDPVEVAFQKLMEADDRAHDEIDKWIKESEAFEKAGAGKSPTLAAKIRQRLDEVDKSYRDFLDLHPKHAKAHLAYGSFRNDIDDDEAALKHWELSRELDPTNPAAWNNLANYYGHRSPVTNSFVYYAKAMELNPKEAVYPWNFATTVYLFRKDAMEFFGISETQVFDKSLDLYRLALSLDSTNFILASDYANSFYGTKPPRYEDGLKAWQDTLKLARDDVEREGVQIHLARININLNRFSDARTHLSLVTNDMYLKLKKRLGERIDEGTANSPKTNGSPSNASSAKPDP